MRKLFLLLVVLVCVSCEHYVTEIRDLTLSGKYVVSKLTVISTHHATQRDTVYLDGGVFTNNSLPHPFNSIKVNDFYLHFTYSEIRMNWINRLQTGMNRDRWEYGESPSIFYHRVPYSYDSYNFGKIEFYYTPLNGAYRPIVFQIDSDLIESIQLSGLEFAPRGKDGPKYKLILSLTRVGP